MKFDKLILEIAYRLSNINEYKKSVVQADLNDLKGYIEDELFKIRIAEHNYKNHVFPVLLENGIETKEAIGLLFLSHITYNLRNELTYSAIWPAIYENLSQYSKMTTFFRDHYLHARHANAFLIECIGVASERFELKNAYDNAGDEHYIRNTILLQIGLLNKFTNLNTWLSGYLNQITIRTLLNKEDDYYSSSFAQGWRVLRKYRDRVIDASVSKSLLMQNVWFKDLDFENLLTASRKSLGTHFLPEEEIENVFYLDKIFFEDKILCFEVNAEDLYALKLEGNDYSVFVDGIYVSKIFRNEEKFLFLDKTIVVNEPVDFNVHIEIKNEDGDTVYNEEVTLFDLHDQVLIFDDKGIIYKDFSKKLPASRKFGLLFDSDLDCDASAENKSEYFSGYVTLASNLSKDNNCMLSYDGEELFSLNFLYSVQKPEWIDYLVVYAADRRLDFGKKVDFHLKIFDPNDDEALPIELPSDAKIIRWTYAGGYVDEEDIVDSTAMIELNPELAYERRHSFMIRYKNKVYQRTVRSSILDQTKVYHVLKKDKGGNIELIERHHLVNHDDLLSSKLHFALFSDMKSDAVRYVKDKMNLYGKVKLNKKTQLTRFPKFGETIILSEHLYNDIGEVLFKVVRQGIVQSYTDSTKSISLSSTPEYIHDCEFVVLDHKYKVRSLQENEFSMSGNIVSFIDDFLSVCIVYHDNYIGSYIQYEQIDFNKIPKEESLLKLLYASYIPILILDKQIFVEWIKENYTLFFSAFLSDYYETPKEQKVVFNFDEVATAIEHLLYDTVFSEEMAQDLLETVVIKGWSDKMLQMPILLVYLLKLSQSYRIITYFVDMIVEAEEPVSRDEKFIESVIGGLLDHHSLNAIQKHNLKIAMHYEYKDYYLREALKRLQG